MQLKRPSQHVSNRRPAFTLTELMISIALSLILILGINAVFKLSSDSIGTGFQLMKSSREFRLVGNTMNNDMNNMADFETSPALIIQSMNTPAFRDKTDMASEPNFTAGSIVDPTGQTFPTGMLQITTPTPTSYGSAYLYPLPQTAPGGPGWTGITQATLYKVRYEIADDRNHRTDIFSFFAKDQYRRQTPPALGGTTFESDFTSGESWISYGHVILPNNNTNPSAAATPPAEHQNWYVPGASSPTIYSLGLSSTTPNNNNPANSYNPNNFFASQWILGRVAVLMADPTNLNIYQNPYKSSTPEPQNYLVDTYNPIGLAQVPAKAPLLPPLGCTSMTDDTTMTAPGPWNATIYHSLCDLAGATMGTFRNTALAVETANNYQAADGWYLPLVANPYIAAAFGASPTAPPGPDSIYRFWAKPWPNKTAAGLTAMQTNMGQEIARTMPVFGRGCSQFIVEYAGDYLQQDATGKTLDIGEDKQLDYDMITNTSTGQTYKRIRWYGLTRSLDNGVTVEDANTPLVSNPPAAGDTEIVRPLWRYVQQLHAAALGLPGTAGFDHMPFEKVGDAGIPAPVTSTSTGGAGFPLGSPPSNSATAQYQTGYTCAWAPDDMHLDESTRTGPYANVVAAIPSGGANGGKPYFPSRSLLPWLIRVTVRLDDPNGRVPQGQQMEFIFKVNRPH